jgi:imidazolonepropionase
MDAKGKKFKTGTDMQDIGEIHNGAILFDEKVLWTGKTEDVERFLADSNIKPVQIIDGSGKTVIPGFCDSHTHIVFGGNRANEFARRLRGATYQEIAAEGGGILTTVKGTRSASFDELYETGKKLAMSAIKHGTTAIEIKSGYGLSVESELKQLRVIKKLKEDLPIHISSTFLGAHDFPPEYKDNRNGYIDLMINEMLPVIAEEGLAEYCDAFIDKGYYTLEEGERILRAGLDYGLKLKVHCDELADFGSAELAAGLGAISADHLLFVSVQGINALKNAGTVATLLPGTAYFIRMPFAPARKLIDNGNIVALSTDCNPGSSFSENMLFTLSQSVINMNMTAEEALTAATLNGAFAIEQSENMGSLEAGKYANFAIANVDSYIDLFYHFGINHIETTYIKGKKLDVVG